MGNFDLRKYLAEGLLYEEEKETDLILSKNGDIKLRPGNHIASYSGWPPSKITFMIENNRYRDLGGFNKNNWKDLLGPKHTFVKIASQIPTEIEAVDELLEITVDFEDLKGITNIKGTLPKINPNWRERWDEYSPEQRIQDYINNGFMEPIHPKRKKGDLDLSWSDISSLPDNLKTVEGDFLVNTTNIDSLSNLEKVGGNLYISGAPLTSLPDNLEVGGNIEASGTNRKHSITSLPNNLKVGGNLSISNTKVSSLPDNLTVGGDFYLSSTPLAQNLFKNYTEEEARQIVDVKGKIVLNWGNPVPPSGKWTKNNKLD